jgi:hypothetical protein
MAPKHPGTLHLSLKPCITLAWSTDPTDHMVFFVSGAWMKTLRSVSTVGWGEDTTQTRCHVAFRTC